MTNSEDCISVRSGAVDLHIGEGTYMRVTVPCCGSNVSFAVLPSSWLHHASWRQAQSVSICIFLLTPDSLLLTLF